MQTKNKQLAGLICVALAVGTMPVIWTGCASNPPRESSSNYLDDATITTKVKAALVKDPIVSALEVHVKTTMGVVLLTGLVNTADQKAQAENVARNVMGVNSVQNGLLVKGQ